MLVGKEEELLTWASASDARAERAEAVQVELGPAPCMAAWQQRSPVAVRDVEAESRWSQVAPALVAAQLQAALSVPVELAGGPIGTLEVYAAGPRDWTTRGGRFGGPCRGGGQSWPGQSAPPSGTRPEGQGRSRVAVAAALRRSELR
jgi:GAF domain